VASLERAVWLLGGATVAAVALGTAIVRHWGDRLPPEAQTLWRDAYRAALGCRYLGRRLPASRWRSPPEALFVAGLLHDVGMILHLAREPELYLRLLRSAPTAPELLEAEREHLGQDHASLGADALDCWEFPVAMAAVCRHHHTGGLRAELLADWEVVRAVDVALAGGEAGDSLGDVSEGLLGDLARYLDEARSEADAFFRAVA
jgi:HD-like signal output (HDOD) protein